MADRYIPEHRRTQFKAKSAFKPDELRRRREEQQVEIRKAKREENLAKRRGIGAGDSRPGASLGAAPDSDDENPPTESQVCKPTYPNPPYMIGCDVATASVCRFSLFSRACTPPMMAMLEPQTSKQCRSCIQAARANYNIMSTFIAESNHHNLPHVPICHGLCQHANQLV